MYIVLMRKKFCCLARLLSVEVLLKVEVDYRNEIDSVAQPQSNSSLIQKPTPRLEEGGCNE